MLIPIAHFKLLSSLQKRNWSHVDMRENNISKWAFVRLIHQTFKIHVALLYFHLKSKIVSNGRYNIFKFNSCIVVSGKSTLDTKFIWQLCSERESTLISLVWCDSSWKRCQCDNERKTRLINGVGIYFRKGSWPKVVIYWIKYQWVHLAEGPLRSCVTFWYKRINKI